MDAHKEALMIHADRCQIMSSAFGVLPCDNGIQLIHGIVESKYIYSDGRYSVSFKSGFQVLSSFNYTRTLPMANIGPSVYTTQITFALPIFKQYVEEATQYAWEQNMKSIESSQKSIEERLEQNHQLKKINQILSEITADGLAQKVLDRQKDLDKKRESFLEL